MVPSTLQPDNRCEQVQLPQSSSHIIYPAAALDPLYSSANLHLPPSIQHPALYVLNSTSDVDSVQTLVTAQTLNLLFMVLGLFVFMAALRVKKLTRLQKQLDNAALNEQLSSACGDDLEKPADLSFSSEADETLDEPAVITPSGTLNFVDMSSFKASTSGIGASASSLSLDNPAFQDAWKKNASIVATIAAKRGRASSVAVKGKLQRWATKRHEMAVQEAVAANQKSSFTLASYAVSGVQVSPSPESSTEGGQVPGTQAAFVKVISPRADRKLRVRRESLRAVARQLEAIQATLNQSSAV